MTHIADMMECPSCKEIELRLTDEEISEDDTMSYSTYECRHCGYLEVHSASLPSWYGEGVGHPKGEQR